jgi:hypothetical protein
MKEVTILDNQVTPQLLFSYDKSDHFAIHEFSIVRNNCYVIMTTMTVNDGINVGGGITKNSMPTPDITGVTITKAVLNGNVEYYYTSSNLGVAGGNNSNNIGTTGITITHAVVNGNVEIYYTSTNTGFNGIFKYSFLAQWS